MNSLPWQILHIFSQYSESHECDSVFVNLNIDHHIGEYSQSQHRYAAYISNLLHNHIKLSSDGNGVAFEHLFELLDWPPLGLILRKFIGSEPHLSLLNDRPPVSARRRLERINSIIDSVADKLISGDIAYGEFAKLLSRENKFVQLLDILASADSFIVREKRERYSLASASIALRKQQRDRYHQQRKRVEIFVEIFRKFKEVGICFIILTSTVQALLLYSRSKL